MATTPSETSIANAALTILGERRINSLDDTSKTAKTLKERYAEVRDEVLRSHPWNFATKRASLAADLTTPLWGPKNAFTLPSDSLRLLRINNPSDIPYRIEGRKIVSDLEAPLEIVYTAQEADPLQMDSLFRQALSAALAADVAEAITGSTTMVETANAILTAKMRQARVPDGQEPSPPQIIAGEWLDSREEHGNTLDRVPSGTGTPL